MTVRVNLVTDDPILAQRLQRYAKRLEGIRIISSQMPEGESRVDVYVVPVRFAGELLDGETRPATWLPVIAYGPRDGLRAAFLSGCRDYLREPWSSEELLFRVDRVAEPSRYSCGWGRLEVDSATLQANGTAIALSFEEFTILRTLLARRGRVVPREVLAYAVWGGARTGSRAIDVHISALRRKIRALRSGEQTNPIRSVRGHGYLIPGGP